MSSSDSFYAEMPGFQDFSGFTDANNYRELPDDWLVVAVDIVHSTLAIERGMYRQVNSVSTATVIATLNVYDRQPLPFVFGGDGATLCVPPKNQEALRQALSASRELALNSFGLTLRVGIIPVSDLIARGYQILVAKFQPHDYHQQAMFRGGGLAYAEALLKDEVAVNPYLVPKNIEAKGNFEGFECRWNEIQSPNEEVLTLMVNVLDQATEDNNRIYAEISQKIQEIYGEESDFHPVQKKHLNLTFSPGKLSAEARIRTFPTGRRKRLAYQVKLWFLAIAGKYLMSRNITTEDAEWGKYKERFIKNTDYRKFDDALRMVISGSTIQRRYLESYLEQLRQQEKIAYGVHTSESSIVTCMVSDYNHNHVHFLDGSRGGYAFAAKMLKQQLQAI
ncbi:MAG: DUF3095 domain-containing protein [Porticoccaceae bacterium]